MNKNIIIVTPGQSGSSVLAGVIATQGYWLGEDTKKKPSFDTHENAGLVDLNIKILEMMGFTGVLKTDMSREFFAKMKRIAESIDSEPFCRFVNECNAHSPWVWKDPRLSFTIHFWDQLMDMEACKFILLTRDPVQNFVRSVLKGKATLSLGEMKTLRRKYKASWDVFFENRGLDCFKCTFEDMLLNPEAFLERLNRVIGTTLTVADLEGVYKGELHKRRYGPFSVAKAGLLYILYRCRAICEKTRFRKTSEKR